MKIYKANGYGYLSNTYVIIEEQSGEGAVVDPGGFSSELKDILGNGEIKKLKYILLTHGHYDHILGVYDIKKSYPDALVAIGEADGKCLTDPKYSLAAHCGEIQNPVEPDITLKEGDVLTLGDTQIKVISTPGHTPGGVCYLIDKENVMFSGDTLFCMTMGRTDLPGGDALMMEKSMQRLSSIETEYDVFPGHNRKTKLSVEKAHNRYMRRL
ncbi:MAG: MBL fold metallo-hydrolase [Clostridiales bacterium]|nr:MBL fold metallo-hydrolase [Clostridiales bacterium]